MPDSKFNQKPGLTNYRYGGHSAVSVDPPAHGVDDPQPKSFANKTPQPYAPQTGAKEPAGIERYGMYGVGPGEGAPTPLKHEQRPVPGPAVLGQFDAAVMRSIDPQTMQQRLAVFEERLATLVDPGAVTTEWGEDGALVLCGTVRDEVTGMAVEKIARETFGDCTLRSQLKVSIR